MAVQPNQNPVEPDTPEQRDPIHHPHRQDHPGPDEGDPPEDEEDTDSDPWWMKGVGRHGPPRPYA